LYAAPGDSPAFYEYDLTANKWTRLADAPGTVHYGGGLSWDGGDQLYLLVGNSTTFASYRISTGTWTTLAPTSTTLTVGGAVTSLDSTQYATQGHGDPTFWRYGPVGVYPDKLTMNQVAFVAPSTLANPAWTNMNVTAEPDQFKIENTENAWVGNGWTDST